MSTDNDRRDMLAELQDVKKFYKSEFTVAQLLEFSKYTGPAWLPVLIQNRDLLAIDKGYIRGFNIPPRISHKLFQVCVHNGAEYILLERTNGYTYRDTFFKILRKEVDAFKDGAIWEVDYASYSVCNISLNEQNKQELAEKGYYSDKYELVRSEWK